MVPPNLRKTELHAQQYFDDCLASFAVHGCDVDDRMKWQLMWSTITTEEGKGALVLDEVSMTEKDFHDWLHTVVGLARQAFDQTSDPSMPRRYNPAHPWFGLRVILIGCLTQLPPMYSGANAHSIPWGTSEVRGMLCVGSQHVRTMPVAVFTRVERTSDVILRQVFASSLRWGKNSPALMALLKETHMRGRPSASLAAAPCRSRRGAPLAGFKENASCARKRMLTRLQRSNRQERASKGLRNKNK